MSLKKKAAIVGLAEMAPQKGASNRTPLSLVGEMTREAIADAGLEKGNRVFVKRRGVKDRQDLVVFEANFTVRVAEFVHRSLLSGSSNTGNPSFYLKK